MLLYCVSSHDRDNQGWLKYALRISQPRGRGTKLIIIEAQLKKEWLTELLFVATSVTILSPVLNVYECACAPNFATYSSSALRTKLIKIEAHAFFATSWLSNKTYQNRSTWLTSVTILSPVLNVYERAFVERTQRRYLRIKWHSQDINQIVLHFRFQPGQVLPSGLLRFAGESRICLGHPENLLTLTDTLPLLPYHPWDCVEAGKYL